MEYFYSLKFRTAMDNEMLSAWQFYGFYSTLDNAKRDMNNILFDPDYEPFDLCRVVKAKIERVPLNVEIVCAPEVVYRYDKNPIRKLREELDPIYPED